MSEGLAVVVPAYNEEKTIGQTLDSLLAQSQSPDAVIVVDNQSADATPDIVAGYQEREDRVQLVHEPEKGTGRACNTGFDYVINEIGAGIIARTDADTLASPGWVKAIQDYMARNPRKQIVTGPNPPREDDEFFRPHDRIAHPLFWVAYRAAAVAVTRSLFPLRVAWGHNLAVRSAAFVEVSGFTDSSIDEVDEDIKLSRALFERYGYGALGYARNMVVHPSMRRIRTVGYRDLADYYAKPSRELRLEKTKGEIDIR